MIQTETSFGTWVKRRRKALDLTREEFARQVGCSTSLIFKIESDERRPSRQMAELLARHLEVPQDQYDLFLKIATTGKEYRQPGCHPGSCTCADPARTRTVCKQSAHPSHAAGRPGA